MYYDSLTESLRDRILSLSENRDFFIIAVDGRCASGKTTLAAELSEKLDCNIIHTDDFYLQPFQRTAERYSEPGGNLDRERLRAEILVPLSKGALPLYQPFLCHLMNFGRAIKLDRKKIYIIEGSYSCHELLRPFYDITFFVTCDRDTQKERILERNGQEKLRDFLDLWIPLEEKYFEAFGVEEKADIVIKT